MLEYSLIMETENLGVADKARLWSCLESVHKAIAKAGAPREALLYNSGDISSEMIDDLRERHPWVTPINLPAGISYYQTKMIGARAVTAELVVFVDSDCIYNNEWLVGLLEPFEDPEVRVVAGETAFVEPGPYSLALSLAHAFEGYSNCADLYAVNSYYANNVAFRRSVLLDLPIPTELPLYRGGCIVHAAELRERGNTIWAQPRSRAAHAMPEGFSNFFWRFLLFGRDRAVRRRLGLGIDKTGGKQNKHGASIYHRLSSRLTRSLRDQPTQRKWVPVALVIAAFARLLQRNGELIASIWPQRFIGHFEDLEGVHYPTIEEYLAKHNACGAGTGTTTSVDG